MASNTAKKRKMDAEEHSDGKEDVQLLRENSFDESYSARVRRRLAEKSRAFPPGVIPLVELNDSHTSSSDSSIASLSDSDNDTDTRKRKTSLKPNLQKAPLREEMGTDLITVKDSLDVSDFWNSPKKTSEPEEKLKSLSADMITLDDSVNVSRDDFEIVLDESDFEDQERERELQREHIVKVRFKGQIHRIPLKKADYFKVLFQNIANIGEVDLNSISIYHKEKPLDQFDSLSNLPLKISDILEAYILQSESGEELPTTTENLIQLKVQTKDRKDVATISIRREDKMQLLMDKYASLKNTTTSKLKFLFDGDLLDPEETPTSLDLEGEECIDVFQV